jgi:hypothetical protein
MDTTAKQKYNPVSKGKYGKVTYFSHSLLIAPLLGVLVVFRLLKAFNHLFFILPVEEDDILRSRLESDALSALEANSSFCNETRTKIF